ncbi:MAG: glycosyltransferase [Terracoccus sp.]
MTTHPGLPVAVVVPARNEAARILATIACIREVTIVEAVIVVDDGSSDGTARVAADAGAEIVRHERGYGRGDALMSGLGRMAGLQRVGRLSGSAAVLFVDADLEVTASDIDAVARPVTAGQADLSIATAGPDLSEPTGAAMHLGGGHGLVIGLAHKGIEDLAGWSPTQPLSGLRCLSPAAVAAATPFARGWGAEVAMTVDVLDAGLTVVEVTCDLRHGAAGTNWRSQVHRAAQYRDIALALGVRRLRRRLEPS